MYNSITISAQLLALADRLGFGKICKEENADKRYRHFTARTQLYAMMIAQLTEQKGLRTIEETIAIDNDLYHFFHLRPIVGACRKAGCERQGAMEGAPRNPGKRGS